VEGTRKLEERWADGRRYTRQQEELLKTFEDAHVATAEALGVQVALEKFEQTAMRVEFAFGILCGTIYGVLAEYQPAATVGAGSVHGAVLFTGASEVVLRQLALSRLRQRELRYNMSVGSRAMLCTGSQLR
jgi:hypothetical protein